jgi:Capsule assembly protein Wzi
MRLNLTIFFVIILLKTSAQSVYAPLNEDYTHLIERYEIKSGSLSNLHTNMKPVRRRELVKLTTDLQTDPKRKLSKVDSFNLTYLQNDSWEYLDDDKLPQSNSKKPFLRQFLRKKSDFYSFQNKDIDLHISPVFQFGFGHDKLVANQPFINTRGIEVRGTINRKLAFYSTFADNQIVYPAYVRDYGRLYSANPYEGFTKITKEDSTKFSTDFFSARGYFTFQALKSVQIQFGHDKNFIGSGIRSLILSDFSAPYLHLKITTQVGKFQYVNIFAQGINKQVPVAANGTEQIPPKYFSMHHLSINILKNLNVGLFETVVFGKRPIGFDFNYLNPIIFLRYVEGHLGSVDNSIVGADFKFNFRRRASIYGQLVLDEFSLKHFKEDNWWATKYAVQIGGRYIDIFGLKNLDLQAEYNMSRPYTYSHNSSYSNFVHYNLPLAHPLGANFKETLIVLRYQPSNRLFLNFTTMLTERGEDYDRINWGGNILRNYLYSRPSDYGNVIGQGRLVTTRHLSLGASYMLRHNLFIDLKAQNRSIDFVSAANENVYKPKGTILSFGVRWNAAQRTLLF